MTPVVGFFWGLLLCVSGVPLELARAKKDEVRAAVRVGTRPTGYYPQTAAPDTAKVQQLNMVMTHDAGTMPTVQYPASHAAVCQGETIVDQFNAGVTVFDVRLDRNGQLVHLWNFNARLFGDGAAAAVTLQNAVRASNRFAIILVKGDINLISNALTANDAGSVFTGPYGSLTTVGMVKNKVIVLPAATSAGAIKLQLTQVDKVMKSLITPTYVQMAAKYTAKCTSNPGAFIKASLSNTGLITSPLCQTVGKMATLQGVMQNMFNGACPVIISVDAGAELLSDVVSTSTKLTCNAGPPLTDNEKDAITEQMLLDYIEMGLIGLTDKETVRPSMKAYVESHYAERFTHV